MDDDLRARAAEVLAAAPCSIEMPAGTGKTQLLGAAAAVAAETGARSLVLTHTNAGVDAIRRRLRTFGVPAQQVRVDTIASWAFALSRAYKNIAQLPIGDLPDWGQTDSYVDGATRVARSRAISKVHASSFDYLFVDEYQDCTMPLHDFLLALAEAVPRAVVLGDRLQGIFTFAGQLASWDQEVLPLFPAHHVPAHPHRWADHNPDLGAWLLRARSLLVPDAVFDFAQHSVPGLRFVHGIDAQTLASVAHGFRDFNESVVLLDKWPGDVAGHASRLGGNYAVMEDIGGRFMRDMLGTVPQPGDPQLARWFAGFAKACVVGLAGIDGPVLGRLEACGTVGHYQRAGLSGVLTALDALQANPSYEQLAVAAAEVRHTEGIRVYRWEAWNDTREALALSAVGGEPPIHSLARVRDRLRRSGRRPESRIASRTLLVKGLEYDHVIIANLNKMIDPCNLYVALSRARKSITILGTTSRVVLRAGN